MDYFVREAAKYAAQAHKGQMRKYHPFTPYFTHVCRVAGSVMVHPIIAGRYTEAAAFLHDVIEDCSADGKAESREFLRDQIEQQFGDSVASIVVELTNVSKLDPTLNRAGRKAADIERLKGVSYEAQVIKLLDRLDNLRDSFHAPKDWLRLYCGETEELMLAIGHADRELQTEILLLASELRNTT